MEMSDKQNKVQVLSTKDAGDFQLLLDWMRFKRNTAAMVRNSAEVKLAHENGLKAYYRLPSARSEWDDGCLREADYLEVGVDTVGNGLDTGKALLVVRIDYHPASFSLVFSPIKNVSNVKNVSNALVVLDFGDQKLSKTELMAVFTQAKTNAHKVVLRGVDSQDSLMGAMSDELSFVRFEPPDEVVIGRILRTHKLRIAVLEATTGGMVAAALMSVPGASAFFISGATVYTGRGAKRILPPSVLEASALFDRANNYTGRANYEASKRKYCEVVSTKMREAMKADVCVVESGTAGPDFYIPDVQAFTAAGVALPDGSTLVELYHGPERDRRKNMEDFTRFTLRTLRKALETKVAHRSRL